METNVQKKTLMEIDAALDRLGRGEAVSRFLNSYGNLRTQKAYSTHLANYFGWLGSM